MRIPQHHATLESPPPRSRRSLVRTSVLAAFVVVALLAVAAPVAAQDPADEPEPAELVPDVAIWPAGFAIDDPQEVIDRLEAIGGVVRASIDRGAGDAEPLVFLSLADGQGERRPLGNVVAEAEDVLARGTTTATIQTGGSAVVDRELADRFNWSATVLAWLALAIGSVFGLLFGWHRGLVAGVTLGLSVAAAGIIGGQVAGSFDGSVAGTALPAALGGLVVGVALTARLLTWFVRPVGVEGADRIRRSVAAVGPELILLFAGLFAVVLLVEPLNPGRSAVSVVAAGALVAALLVLAVIPPAMVMLEGRAFVRSSWPGLARVPDGANVSVLVAGLSALALALLAVVAVTTQVGGSLLDVDQLDENGEPGQVVEVMAGRGGDPTEALVAVNVDAAPADFVGWAAAAAERPEVAWVDVGDQRFANTGPMEVEPTALLTEPTASDVAVMVLSVPAYSFEGQALTERLLVTPLDGSPPEFLGRAATSGELAGSRTPVWLAVLFFAVVGAIAVLILTGNWALAAVAFLLRLLGGAATVGLFTLLNTEPALAPLMTALATVSLGSLLAEIELVRRLELEADQPVTETPTADVPAGFFGVLGLALLALAGVLVAVAGWFGGGPGTVWLVLALALSALVEIGAGFVVLRPALLGQRGTYQTLARPLRVALHGRSTGDPDGTEPPDDNPIMREVVSELVQAEFWLQVAPDEAWLGSVFVADTPVYRQADERRGHLASAGLRVAGRSPRLVWLRTVRERLPAIVTVTVDHPESQLLDAAGNVLGVRRAERRVGRLWLSYEPDTGWRITESIELGSTEIDDESIPALLGAEVTTV